MNYGPANDDIADEGSGADNNQAGRREWKCAQKYTHASVLYHATSEATMLYGLGRRTEPT